jgi:gliding motility-associated-like protein
MLFFRSWLKTNDSDTEICNPFLGINQHKGKLKSTLLFALLFCLATITWSQCLMFNEILINPSGSNDGSNAPNTSEWVELYNICDDPIDVSCFAITDGDFALTFPQGTIIPANSYYVIGSSNSGIPVDLNWATCNCTTNPNEVGIFTNGSEQLILVDENGGLLNGIYWGGGQFPVNDPTPALPGCPTQIITFNAPGIFFEAIPYPATEDCTVSRLCDGSWSATCGASSTPGAVNGQELVVADFSFSDGEICQGDCISFEDLSQGATSWEWSFFGASVATSNEENPGNICYDEAGIFGVQLEITSNCGPATTFYQNIIEVIASETPEITPDGPITLCNDEEVTLTATGTGIFQWQLNDQIIPGETESTFIPTVSGTYNVAATNGICTSLSLPVEVVIATTDEVVVTPSGNQTICEGETILLECESVFDTYQWLLDGNLIPTATNAVYEASETGVYSLQITSGNCIAESDEININVVELPEPVISQGASINFCADDISALNATNNFDFYQWNLNGVAIPGANGSTFLPQTNGNYSLEVANGTCVAESESIQVAILDVPDADILPAQDVTTCLSSVLLDSGDNPNVQWFLNNEAMLGETSNQLTATVNGDYYYTTFFHPSCPKSSQVIAVDLNVPLNLNIVASADTVCEGELITLTAVGNYSDIIWSNGQETEVIQAPSSGLYVATASDNFCTAIDSIEVFFSPVPEVTAPDDFDSPCSEFLELAGIGTGTSYWTLNGGLIANGADVSILSPSRTTTYELVSEIGSCIASDSVTVNVDCVFIYAPNSFTPDGDGLNDIFRVVVGGISNYYLRIFDRWGAIVFETDDPSAVWTGGVDEYYVADGIYVWRIDALDAQKNEVLDKSQRTGTVLVIR